MKFLKTISPFVVALSFCFTSCEGSDRPTGNDKAAQQNQVSNDSASVNENRPDTSVTGVPGNTNAVNASGNAGNGSGMGSSSTTEAAKKN